MLFSLELSAIPPWLPPPRTHEAVWVTDPEVRLSRWTHPSEHKHPPCLLSYSFSPPGFKKPGNPDVSSHLHLRLTPSSPSSSSTTTTTTITTITTTTATPTILVCTPQNLLQRRVHLSALKRTCPPPTNQPTNQPTNNRSFVHPAYDQTTPSRYIFLVPRSSRLLSTSCL